MEFKELETNRLYLKEITKEYSKNLFDYLSKDEVTRYLGKSSLKSIQEAYEIIYKIESNFEQNRSIRWGLVLKKNNKLIGTMGYDGISMKNRRADMGYDISSDYWRQGFASEAINEILRYGFYNLSLNRVGAVVFPQNTPSHNLLKKVGFKEEGLLREYIIQDSLARDVIAFSLLKNDFKV